MAKHTKRMKAIREQIDRGRQYPAEEAFGVLKGLSSVKFVESVEAAVNLGVDPRKSDQVVRGSTVLPNGLGKQVRVAVFTQGANVEAARAVGTRDAAILLRHILPNVMVPLTVQTSLSMGTAILFAAGLGLGIGVQPPTPEWGAMLGSARAYLFHAPHVATFPGIAIFLAVLSFNLLGDGLRDALDPRFKL